MPWATVYAQTAGTRPRNSHTPCLISFRKSGHKILKGQGQIARTGAIAHYITQRRAKPLFYLLLSFSIFSQAVRSEFGMQTVSILLMRGPGVGRQGTGTHGPAQSVGRPRKDIPIRARQLQSKPTSLCIFMQHQQHPGRQMELAWSCKTTPECSWHIIRSLARE